MQTLTVQTQREKQVVDITPEIGRIIRQQGFKDGVCHIFVTHTTAALSTADLDPGTDLDMLDAFTTMIPALNYRHPHNPAHAPDHILATLVGPSVAVPVEGGRLVLGTWQRVVLFEFDGPRRRQIAVTLLPEQ
ncbi:MAG TPA: YjbQ family protein [Chloroflexi bacterium]|nr:YjbQ family protein [Chloroflexota bacterium]